MARRKDSEESSPGSRDSYDSFNSPQKCAELCLNVDGSHVHPLVKNEVSHSLK